MRNQSKGCKRSCQTFINSTGDSIKGFDDFGEAPSMKIKDGED